MKKLLILSLIPGLLLCLYSCSTHIYTHKQVMQSLRTKSDVAKRFGAPTKKEKNEVFETWTYSMATAADKTPDTAKTADSLNSTPYVEPGKYVKFMFDTTGHVMGYKSHDVNLGYTKRDSFGKGVVHVLIGTAAVTFIVLCVIIDYKVNGGDIFN